MRREHKLRVFVCREQGRIHRDKGPWARVSFGALSERTKKKKKEKKAFNSCN